MGLLTTFLITERSRTPAAAVCSGNQGEIQCAEKLWRLTILEFGDWVWRINGAFCPEWNPSVTSTVTRSSKYMDNFFLDRDLIVDSWRRTRSKSHGSDSERFSIWNFDMILHEMFDRSVPSRVHDGAMNIEDRSNIWMFSIHGAFRLARVLDGFGTVLETKKKRRIKLVIKFLKLVLQYRDVKSRLVFHAERSSSSPQSPEDLNDDFRSPLFETSTRCSAIS